MTGAPAPDTFPHAMATPLTPHQRASQIVLTRVPPAVTRFLNITWGDRTHDDAEGSWLYATLGTPFLGYIKFRVRVAGGDPRVEMLPVR